ncbi:hypothetical protein NDU88_001554 [Pleurodeles waltl]|uniref:Uncharacterized protein n=1 Tax=Pleurodeles waltl TaxID=8319 RepID=A0AAV7WMA8_PLEWA|nr:hypothetical protein NDU88_001554 [Pleurodeles waltl]
MGEEVPPLSSPPKEEAHSDDSNSGLLDLGDLPGPSGTTGQPVTQQTTTEPPPSGTKTTAPTQRTHISVSRTRQSAVCPPVQGPQATPRPQHNQGPGVSGSGHTVQGTEAQANRDTGRTAVCQGEDRTREPTFQDAPSKILGAYQHSSDMTGQILDNVQKNRRLQEGQYLGIREDLQAINNTQISIAGVPADIGNIMREATAHQPAPATSQSSEQPSTSTAASGQEAPLQDQQATSTPPPAEGQCPSKEGNIACHRQGRADPGGLWQAEHPLLETVRGSEMLGTEDRGGQLGMASQRGRGACRTLTSPPMARILVVAYPELDGHLRTSLQPQGDEYSDYHYNLRLVGWYPGGDCVSLGASRPGQT